MRTLHPPGLQVLVTVPDDRADQYLRQGWVRVDDAPSREQPVDDGSGVAAEVTTTGELVPPPRRGPGSSVSRWRDYATAAGVEVPEDATRDEVVAALDAAGVPTK